MAVALGPRSPLAVQFGIPGLRLARVSLRGNYFKRTQSKSFISSHDPSPNRPGKPGLKARKKEKNVGMKGFK